MMKSMKTVKSNYQGRRLDLNSLYAAVRKKRGKAKILASIIVGIGKDEDGNEVSAKVIFVRDRNRRSKWLALISTDTSLADLLKSVLVEKLTLTKQQINELLEHFIVSLPA